ncbi:MAG: acyl-CoA desaturase [Phycisphaerales bacterium]|nr:MAG: acyl-CoA desaturase [Phycisphaerales bacterium]
MSLWERVGKNHIIRSVVCWFDDEAAGDMVSPLSSEEVDWVRVMPFLLLHLACFAVIWTGWSLVAVWTAIGLYLIRMLAVTGVYHRYFSHRAYETSRFWQFVFALIATSSAQKGPLWWAANHRHHHRFADKPEDIHSPVLRGFLWSHVLWILTPKYLATDKRLVKNWLVFPELVFLNRFSILPPLGLLGLLVIVGEVLRVYVPSTGTSGVQMGAWGFCISTVALFHATATINSLDHMIGRRRYDTPDHSRNNWFLALITLGEGWHNNHHHYPIAARNGFFWWEVDVTYYVLVILSWLGIVRHLTPLPPKKRDSSRIKSLTPARAAT